MYFLKYKTLSFIKSGDTVMRINKIIEYTVINLLIYNILGQIKGFIDDGSNKLKNKLVFRE